MRRRRIIMFFAMIMSIALIGVGFAAWIITQPTQDKVADGTITVDTVEVHGWEFEHKWVNEKNTIVFGTPSDTTSITNQWLTNVTKENTDPIGVENLSVTLNVKAVKAANANSFDVTQDAYAIFELGTMVEDEFTPITDNTYQNYFTYTVTNNVLKAEELEKSTGVDVVGNVSCS